jgi:GNAT superfamily N-acetyltransferase
MNASKIVSRSAAIFRSAGARGLWFKILGEFAYRRSLLLERALDAPLPALAGAGEPLELEVLDASDAEELVDLHAREQPQASDRSWPADIWHRKRFAEGYTCFAARRDRRIISYSWTAVERAPVLDLRCDIRLDPSDVYVFGSYTCRHSRGQGVSPRLAVAIIRHYHALGYRHIVSAISPENRASLQARHKVGFRVFAKIGYVGIPVCRHYFSTTPRITMHPW